MKKISTIIILSSLLVLNACSDSKNSFDASGSFEAEETIISSEANGKLEILNIEEGQILEAGETIGYVDSTQVYLKKKQVEAQISALLSKKPNVPIQLAALNEQLKAAIAEKIRIENLVAGNAATTKQLDDVNASIEVVKKQIDALKSSLEISSQGINNDASSLFVQLEQVEDQLSKCTLINPVNGTVLAKYSEQYEMTAAGKPLYKIADLSSIILRAYISGNQLPLVQLNQKVSVLTDDGNGAFKETEGTITWISDKAEFTPKTIQTKEERVNMVYAIKVKVENDGFYKIGMYGEIKF